MCQLENGALFKMKREKLERLEVLFFQIRSCRDSGASSADMRPMSVTQMARVFIVDAVGRNDLQLARLIYNRAKKAGLSV